MKKPNKNTKPTHRYMGELFLVIGSRIYIWSFMLDKWMTLWKSFEHEELILLFNYSDRFRVIN